jgi:hypothetical protein
LPEKLRRSGNTFRVRKEETKDLTLNQTLWKWTHKDGDECASVDQREGGESVILADFKAISDSKWRDV